MYDLNSQFLVAFDRNANLLAVGAGGDLVGKNFFGNYTQNFVNHNKILNDFTHDLLAGKVGYAVYDYGKGERLNTESPILVGSEPSYFLQVVTPTSTIYSQVNSVLFTEGIKLFTLISGTTAAIILLVYILGKWNRTLGNEVKRRTHELNESNDKLNVANEELKKHERAQKDFINMAHTSLEIQFSLYSALVIFSDLERVIRIKIMIYWILQLGVLNDCSGLQKIFLTLLE